MTKKQKQPLFLKGYETNPQGKQVPIYTTIEPPATIRGMGDEEKIELARRSSLPGVRKKKKKPEKRSFRAMGGKG